VNNVEKAVCEGSIVKDKACAKVCKAWRLARSFEQLDKMLIYKFILAFVEGAYSILCILFILYCMWTKGFARKF